MFFFWYKQKKEPLLKKCSKNAIYDFLCFLICTFVESLLLWAEKSRSNMSNCAVFLDFFFKLVIRLLWCKVAVFPEKPCRLKYTQSKGLVDKNLMQYLVSTQTFTVVYWHAGLELCQMHFTWNTRAVLSGLKNLYSWR